MQQSLIIITKPLSEIQDIALQESWPVFLSFTHNTAQIANCTTDQEESEFAIILAFAFALWIRDFKSFLETKSLTSTIFHKKDTRDEIMIRATFGSGFFAGLYISWSKYLVASNATQPNSEASTKVNLSPGHVCLIQTIYFIVQGLNAATSLGIVSISDADQFYFSIINTVNRYMRADENIIKDNILDWIRDQIENTEIKDSFNNLRSQETFSSLSDDEAVLAEKVFNSTYQLGISAKNIQKGYAESSLEMSEEELKSAIHSAMQELGLRIYSSDLVETVGDLENLSIQFILSFAVASFTLDQLYCPENWIKGSGSLEFGNEIFGYMAGSWYHLHKS